MKLSQIAEGVLDYRGDVAAPATPQGAPLQVPGSGVAGADTDMSQNVENSVLECSKHSPGECPHDHGELGGKSHLDGQCHPATCFACWKLSNPH